MQAHPPNFPCPSHKSPYDFNSLLVLQLVSLFCADMTALWIPTHVLCVSEGSPLKQTGSLISDFRTLFKTDEFALLEPHTLDSKQEAMLSPIDSTSSKSII